jgi:DNA mismatch endonuclease (patch repair protein)
VAVTGRCCSATTRDISRGVTPRRMTGASAGLRATATPRNPERSEGEPRKRVRPPRRPVWSPSGPVWLATDAETSVRLAGVRQRGTSAEVIVGRMLGRLGHRFRTRNRDLPGSPDLANRRQSWAIFVHGCFWHRHAGCVRTTTPKRNRSFWLEKFAANRRRDRRAIQDLASRGFQCLVVWECEALRAPSSLADRLRSFLSTPP